ncbi:LIM-domain binding protein-domain-containing protein [Linnemannia elongata]|nr:LIM-domain binding protein-domain-containing protein [Linnemannia elongata]
MMEQQSTLNPDFPQDGPDPKAMLRLLDFCRYLGHGEENQSIQSWQAFVNRFYSNEGRQKYTLVNPMNNDSRTFEIPVTSLPKLYHTNYQSGVKEMKLTLDGTIEQPSKAPLIVECDKVSLLSDYTSGSKVMSVGSVRVMFATDYKIDLLEITISDFTELIPRPKDDALESPVIDPKADSKKKNASKKGSAAAIKGSNYSVPESVVNEFGVTHKTMRTLGISDIKSKMPDLLGTTTGANRRSPDSSLAFNVQGLQNGVANPDMPGLPIVTSTISTAPPAQAPFVTFGTMPQTDGSHILAGLSSPGIMKRRFSTSLVTIAGGVVGPGTMQSPPMETAQAGAISAAGTPTLDYASVGGLATHLNNVQGPGGAHGGFVNVSGSFTIPSGVSMAPVAPPSTVALPAPNATKSTKRAKNASVASTPTLSNKGAAAGGTTSSTATTTTGRSRKGTGRKDSSAKRKGSLAGETAAVDATTGSLTPTIPNAAETGSPTTRPTAQFRNRPAKNVGSPVSIPSPISTPMMSVSLSDIQQVNGSTNNTNLNQVPGGLPVANLRGMSNGFEAMSPPFYSALAPNQTMLMSTNGAGNMEMDTTFQIPRTAMDESEEWTGALDFMTDPKGLDMGEFIFEPSYDKEPEPAGSNSNVLTSTDTPSGTQISL